MAEKGRSARIVRLVKPPLRAGSTIAGSSPRGRRRGAQGDIAGRFTIVIDDE